MESINEILDLEDAEALVLQTIQKSGGELDDA